MQCGIKRACIYPQQLAGVQANGLADAVTVLRAPQQCLQDQQIQSALQQFDSVLVLSGVRHVDSLQPQGVGCLLPRLYCQEKRTTDSVCGPLGLSCWV